MSLVVNTVKLEILAVIKFGGLVLNHHCKNFGGFLIWRFDKGSPHVYMQEILADFYLAVAS